MDKRFTSLDKEVGSLNKKLSSLDKKVGSLDKRVASLEKKYDILADSLLATRIEIRTEFASLERRLEEKFDKKLIDFSDKILTAIDAVMGEIKTMREEHAAFAYRQSKHSDQLEDHETRVVKLETQVFQA